MQSSARRKVATVCSTQRNHAAMTVRTAAVAIYRPCWLRHALDAKFYCIPAPPMNDNENNDFAAFQYDCV